MSEWKPIESAPRDGTRVLLCDRHRGATWIGFYHPVYQSGYRPTNPWSSLMLNHEYQATPSWSPTHWQHIPEPPK